MGVTGLWSLLSEKGLVERASGDKSHQQLLQTIQDKVLAVDLSAWLLEGSHQDAISPGHPQCEFAAAKKRMVSTVMNRVTNVIRYGAHPVLVLEGTSPAAKQQLLRERYSTANAGALRSDAAGQGRSWWQDTIDCMQELGLALGLPVVRAPGEGEAMCAALCQQGLADACVTSDADALLFGAPVVLRNLHLQVQEMGKSTVEVYKAAALQAPLGACSPEEVVSALLVVAVLSGCDYARTGVPGIGVKKAWQFAQLLLQGAPEGQRAQLLEQLLDGLASGRSGPEAAAKVPGSRHPKPAAGARKLASLHKLVAAAQKQQPQLLQTLQMAAGVLRQQRQLALAELQRLQLSRESLARWQHRPHWPRLRSILASCHFRLDKPDSSLQPLPGSPGSPAAAPRKPAGGRTAREFVLPLLVEWDVRNPPGSRCCPSLSRDVNLGSRASAEGDIAGCGELRYDAEAEFVVERLEGRALSGCSKNPDSAWCLLLRIQRLPEPCPELAESDRTYLSGSKHRMVSEFALRRHRPDLMAEPQPAAVPPRRGGGTINAYFSRVRKPAAAGRDVAPAADAVVAVDKPQRGRSAKLSTRADNLGRGAEQPLPTAHKPSARKDGPLQPLQHLQSLHSEFELQAADAVQLSQPAPAEEACRGLSRHPDGCRPAAEDQKQGHCTMTEPCTALPAELATRPHAEDSAHGSAAQRCRSQGPGAELYLEACRSRKACSPPSEGKAAVAGRPVGPRGSNEVICIDSSSDEEQPGTRARTRCTRPRKPSAGDSDCFIVEPELLCSGLGADVL